MINHGALFFLIGTLAARIAVALGAFGAHALKAQLAPELLDIFETGVRYQIYHALAILVVAFTLARWETSVWLIASGWLFAAGIVLFSSSLYLLVLTGTRWLGAITPLGGIAFIVGWICLAIGAWQA